MKSTLFVALAALLAIASGALSGCGILYTNIRVPRAYRSATPADVKSSPSDPIVSGEACNTSILFLFAWGDAGYAAASGKALKDHPNAMLYDVKADMKALSVLGLYTRTCTIVTGKAAQP